MDPVSLLSFTAAAILLTLAPGPDIMYLLTKSLSAGTRHGIALAAGLSCGCVFHTALVAFGAAAFLQHSPAAFQAVLYSGAAYLLYLAWSAFRAAPEKLTLAGDTDSFRPGALYRRGLFMNASNPKVLLFFLALLPQFIDSSGSWPPAVQIGVLGLTFSIQAFCCFSFVAFCAGKIRDRVLNFPNFSLIMNRIEGTLLSLLAGAMLFF